MARQRLVSGNQRIIEDGNRVRTTAGVDGDDSCDCCSLYYPLYRCENDALFSDVKVTKADKDALGKAVIVLAGFCLYYGAATPTPGPLVTPTAGYDSCSDCVTVTPTPTPTPPPPPWLCDPDRDTSGMTPEQIAALFPTVVAVFGGVKFCPCYIESGGGGADNSWKTIDLGFNGHTFPLTKTVGSPTAASYRFIGYCSPVHGYIPAGPCLFDGFYNYGDTTCNPAWPAENQDGNAAGESAEDIQFSLECGTDEHGDGQWSWRSDRVQVDGIHIEVFFGRDHGIWSGGAVTVKNVFILDGDCDARTPAPVPPAGFVNNEGDTYVNGTSGGGGHCTFIALPPGI